MTTKSRCNFFLIETGYFFSHPLFVFHSDALRLREENLCVYKCALYDFLFLSLPGLNISCVDLFAYDIFIS